MAMKAKTKNTKPRKRSPAATVEQLNAVIAQGNSLMERIGAVNVAYDRVNKLSDQVANLVRDSTDADKPPVHVIRDDLVQKIFAIIGLDEDGDAPSTGFDGRSTPIIRRLSGLAVAISELQRERTAFQEWKQSKVDGRAETVAFYERVYRDERPVDPPAPYVPVLTLEEHATPIPVPDAVRSSIDPSFTQTVMAEREKLRERVKEMEAEVADATESRDSWLDRTSKANAEINQLRLDARVLTDERNNLAEEVAQIQRQSDNNASQAVLRLEAFDRAHAECFQLRMQLDKAHEEVAMERERLRVERQSNGECVEPLRAALGLEGIVFPFEVIKAATERVTDSSRVVKQLEQQITALTTRNAELATTLGQYTGRPGEPLRLG